MHTSTSRAKTYANAGNVRATALFLWMARRAKRLARTVSAKRWTLGGGETYHQFN
jgi:hypothetical protein